VQGQLRQFAVFWDVLFGSARIAQRYPAWVGLRDDQLFGAEKWSVELFYPAFRSRRSRSGLVPGGSATMTASTLLHATIRSRRHQMYIEKSSARSGNRFWR
jgi:hypothetical protein